MTLQFKARPALVDNDAVGSQVVIPPQAVHKIQRNDISRITAPVWPLYMNSYQWGVVLPGVGPIL